MRARRRGAALISLLVVAAIAGIAGPAHARAGGVVSFEAPGADGAGAVERYWTPGRVAAARSREATVSPGDAFASMARARDETTRFRSPAGP